MAEFTKEQLISRARIMIRKHREMLAINPDYDGIARDVELFEIALASLTAEPVGEVVLGEYDDSGCHPDARVVCIAADGQADWENFKDGTRLYATPPTPVVPKELLSAMEEVLRISDRDHDAWHKAKAGIVSCRAAMLQGAGPVQGWIPCSERMPDFDTRVILYFPDYGGHIEDGCIGDEGDGPYHYFFDGDSLRHEPTHWMPLPATPQ